MRNIGPLGLAAKAMIASTLVLGCLDYVDTSEEGPWSSGGTAGDAGNAEHGGAAGMAGAGGWSGGGSAGQSGVGGSPGKGGSSTGGASGKGGSGGHQDEVPEGSIDLGAYCTSLFDCPNWMDHGACDDVECINQRCYRVPEPAGKAVGDDELKGNCLGLLCDGKGGTIEGALDTDVPTQVCATFTCAAGVLTTTPLAAGTSCSKYGATCDGQGVCVGAGTIACTTKFDCPAPPNGCYDEVCDQQTCVNVPRPDGANVSDPVGNCKKHVCDGAGNPVELPNDDDIKSDGNDCTIDDCSGGVPVYTSKPQGHPCRQKGHYCTADSSCVGCPIVSPTCQDYGVGEPDNATEAGAYHIDSISDNDDAGYTACGVLSGASDVDWWKYHGSDGFAYVVDPYQSISAALPLALCAYFSCGSKTPTLTCSGGATPDVSAQGLPGCCATVTPDDKGFPGATGCQGTGDDDMTVVLKVSNPGPIPCIPYELSIHF